MASHASSVVKAFSALDKLLTAAGFPPTSPWWIETVGRFYRSGRRQLVVRAGRRAGKSSTLCRLAVVEALYGQHRIPPGDVGVVAFISTTRDEAAQRLRTIADILTALRVKFRRSGDTIEVSGRPVIFKVFPASVAGVSGFTGICVIADEVAKWRDVDTGANPATEVLASVRPTMATQPEARIVLSSSPMATLDAHYDAFEAGDNGLQIVASAPTWIANPSVTEADTHALEADLATWRREYLAIPQTELETSLLVATELDAVTRKEPAELPRERGHSYIAAMDPATRGDVWTLVIMTSRILELENGARRSIKSVASVRSWQGSRAAPLSPDAVLKEIAQHLKGYGLDFVWSDQASGDALRDIASRYGLSVVVEPSTAARNLALYEGLRTRVADRELEIPPDPDVRGDLLAVRKKITRAGIAVELGRQNGRHADYAPPIALLASKRIADPEAIGPKPGSAEYFRDLEARLEAQRIERVQREIDDREEWL